MTDKYRKYFNNTRANSPDKTFRNIVIAITAVFIVFPFYWMILTSLKPANDIMLSPTIFIPSYLEIKNYIEVWKAMPLLKYMLNSIIVAGGSTVVCLLISTMAAFSLSSFRTKIKGLTLSILMFSQLVPFTLPFIAIYRLFFKVGLTNTYTGLIIAYSIAAIPFCTLMMRGYFTQALPISLIESARIDGCSKWGTFHRIALPLVAPGLVATALFSIIVAWNDFVWASVMLSDMDKKPVSIGIYDFIGQYGGNVNIALSMATAVLTTIPIMLLFAFLQKNIVSGLTSGAVKG